MKISIYNNPTYPYSIHKEDDFHHIIVDKKTLQRWNKVYEEFASVQEEIE